MVSRTVLNLKFGKKIAEFDKMQRNIFIKLKSNLTWILEINWFIAITSLYLFNNRHFICHFFKLCFVFLQDFFSISIPAKKVNLNIWKVKVYFLLFKRNLDLAFQYLLLFCMELCSRSPPRHFSTVWDSLLQPSNFFYI